MKSFAAVIKKLFSVREKRRVTATEPNTGSEAGRVHAPTSPLLRLPQELLDHIVTYLDIPDVACLSICRKDLCCKLGTDRWQALRIAKGHECQRKEFLTRLARDEPTIFFCHNCSYLHLTARVGRAAIHYMGGRLPCIEYIPYQRDIPGQSFENYAHCSTYLLTFVHVQLVMARHHGGHDRGIPLESLKLTEFGDTRQKPEVLTLLNVEPKIIDNELFLRVQQWIIFDQGDQPTFQRHLCPSICSHINKFSSSATLDTLLCQPQHIGARASCPTCSLLYRCSDCAVEYESDALNLDDGRVAVVITKWLNLGTGESPSEPHWRRHLYPPFDGKAVAMEPGWVGSKSRFEGCMGRSQATATHEDALLLRGDSFRTKLHYTGGWVWRNFTRDQSTQVS